MIFPLLYIVAEEDEICIISRGYPSRSSLTSGVTSLSQISSTNGDDINTSDDVMALSRVNKRLTMVESELDLTKHRLIATQESLQVGQASTEMAIKYLTLTLNC